MTRYSMLDLVPVVQGGAASRRRSPTPPISPAMPRPGLHALLGRRAPRHGGDRQRRDFGGDRASRPCHQHDPDRVGRDHAAQPCALGDRRTVRHARRAVPRAHRPGAGARAGIGPARRPRDPPHARQRRRRPSRATSSSCRAISPTTARPASLPLPAPAPGPSCGSSDRVCSARISPPRWGCPMPSPRISRRGCWTRRSPNIAATSAHRLRSTSPI